MLLGCWSILSKCEGTGHDTNDFCERDEHTGACKKPSSVDVEDDEPCWVEDSTKKQDSPYGKLVRLNGVKVG